MFSPDPKPEARTKKRYKCKYCKEYYMMEKEEYQRNSLTARSKCCGSIDCLAQAAGRHIAKSRKEKRVERGKKKMDLKPRSYWENRLQDKVNQIVKMLDSAMPCIARPAAGGKMDAGHFHSVGSAKNLRYHFWNIHKQSVHSNQHKSGDTVAYISGLDIRYGVERREYILELHRLYPLMKVSTYDLRHKHYNKANLIIRELKSGNMLTRDECNMILGIHTSEYPADQVAAIQKVY